MAFARTECFLKRQTEEVARDGCVYLDPELHDNPSTHVLLVGIGSIPNAPKDSDLDPLTSPPISARALADWFLGKALPNSGKGTFFFNPERPLGSLSIALSVPAGGKEGYRDAKVPRATKGALVPVFQGWYDRVRAHRDNTALLYVAGHGFAEGARSAFFLENFGETGLLHDGFVDIERLKQLLGRTGFQNGLYLFDCCRTSSDLIAPTLDGALGGTALFNGVGKGLEGPGHMTLFATTLAEYADGRKDDTTLFADSLLRALSGVGADYGSKTDTHARVTTGFLMERVKTLLEYHRDSNGLVQRPQSVAHAAFEIHRVPLRRDVEVYVDRPMPSKSDGQVVFRADGVEVARIDLVKSRDPFFCRDVAPMVRVQVFHDHAGKILAETLQTDADRPVQFLKFGASASARIAAPVSLSGGGGTRAGQGGPRSRFLLSFTGARDAVATVRAIDPRPKRSTGAHWSGRIQEDSERGSGTPVEFSPGRYEIVATAADGRIVRVNVTLGRAEAQRVVLVFEAAPPTGVSTMNYMSWLSRIDLRRLGTRALPNRIEDSTLGDFAGSPWEGSGDPYGWNEPRGSAYFESWSLGLWHLVPGLASNLRFDSEHWRPSFDQSIEDFDILDAQGKPSRWSPLIAFLRRRDLANAAATLNEAGLPHELTVRAVKDKLGNPLAAAAGALAAVASGDPTLLKKLRSSQDGDWMANLSNWFPGLPDGPIILATRLLRFEADQLNAREQAKGLLLEAYRRGIPVYSLSVDWLAQGLGLFAGEDDPETARKAEMARSLRARVDPFSAFTAIKVL